MSRIRIGLIVIAASVLFINGSACLVFWLERPARATIQLPVDLSERAQPVRFGADHRIRGWWIVSSDRRAPTVILMHGVRSNRLSMVDRARFLANAGYNVLLFDFQAHGESEGKRITFGELESEDAKEAFANRLQIVLGPQAEHLALPAFWLMRPFSRTDLDRLQPLKYMQAIQYPVLFLSGSSDDRTTIEQARRFAVFPAVTFQEVAGAGHVDLHRYAGEQYERWVLEFFQQHLRSGD